jgi:thiol-disulfide isomerase/thioredoxin
MIAAAAVWAIQAIPAHAQFLKDRDRAPAPEFSEVTRWIGTEPLSMKQLRGKVAVIHFWTHGCYNCVNNYPHYKAWNDRYAGKDVVFIGIHTPETEGERDIERIEAQLKKNGLKFKVAVDNDFKNWRAWKNRYRPTVYVVDRKGVVRYGWEGELNSMGQNGEETVRKVIDALLEEPR